MLTLANDTTCMKPDYDYRPAVETLAASGLILFPTDTIWGIGCNATDPVAIEKVFELKKRPHHQPMTILVSSIDMLKNYVEHLHPRIETLLMYHTRPLTIIYERAKNLPTNAYKDGGSVAIRLVQEDFCKNLITDFGKPILCTSAKIEGMPMPSNFGEISSAIFTKVDFIVKHRQTDKNMGEKSVVARLSNARNPELNFLRG